MPKAPQLQELAASPAAFRDHLRLTTSAGVCNFGKVLADYQRRDNAIIDPCLVAIAHGKKPPVSRIWLERTKGAAKDTDLAVNCLWQVAFAPRTVRILIGAGDADQAGEIRTIWEDALKNTTWLGPRPDGVPVVETHKWTLRNPRTGSAVEIVTSDPRTTPGARKDVVIINELTCTTESFATAVMDNADKMPNGLAIIATNAGFDPSWQAAWRAIAVSSPDRWRVCEYKQPAPWIDMKAVEESERRNRSSPGHHARLWAGLWVAGEGDALQDEDIQAAIRDDLKPMTAEDAGGWGFVGALDLGIRNDQTAFLVLAKKKERYRLADLQLWKAEKRSRVDLAVVERAVIESHKKFKFKTVAYDNFQCEMLASRLKQAHVPMQEVVFGGQNMTKMATAVLDAFNSRSIEIYKHPQLISDLGRLRIVEKSYGCRLEAPRGPDGHGDAATALSLALMTAKDIIVQYRKFGMWG